MTGPQRRILFDLAERSEHNIVLLGNCDEVKPGVRCVHQSNEAVHYDSVFAQSTFCLIARTERLLSINLIEALASKCIPIFLADNIVLPFGEVYMIQILFLKLYSAYDTLFVYCFLVIRLLIGH